MQNRRLPAGTLLLEETELVDNVGALAKAAAA